MINQNQSDFYNGTYQSGIFGLPGSTVVLIDIVAGLVILGRTLPCHLMVSSFPLMQISRKHLPPGILTGSAVAVYGSKNFTHGLFLVILDGIPTHTFNGSSFPFRPQTLLVSISRIVAHMTILLCSTTRADCRAPSTRLTC